MMKARGYNRVFFRGKEVNGERRIINPKVYAIEESNQVDRRELEYFNTGLKDRAMAELNTLLDTMTDAGEYGSILNVENHDWELLKELVGGNTGEGSCRFSDMKEVLCRSF